MGNPRGWWWSQIWKHVTRNKFFILFFTIILTNLSYAEVSFDTLKTKQTSYLDFFLLKFESKLLNRALILRKQAIPSRVQYSHVSSTVEYKKKENKIFINIYAVMDKTRYTKKKYREKISDCNQIRNLIFYRKHGYKFFTQKRDPKLSTDIMNSRKTRLTDLRECWETMKDDARVGGVPRMLRKSYASIAVKQLKT